MKSNRINKIQKLRRLQEELDRRNEERPLREYEPRSFHHEFIVSDSNIKLFVGSNQSGKTTVVAIEVIAFALGYRPWVKYFYERIDAGEYKWADKLDLSKRIPEKTGRTPPLMIAVIGKNFKNNIMKAFFPKLKDLLPGKYLKGGWAKGVKYSNGRLVETMLFTNGSQIHFFSGEQDDDSFESGTWDVIVFDEPPKESHYTAMVRGAMVKEALFMFSMTPLSEPWIFDGPMADAKKKDSDTMMTHCDLYDEQIDWIKLEMKQKLEETARRRNPGEVAARIHGQFSHLMGRIIGNYEPDVHFVDPLVRPYKKSKAEEEKAGGGSRNVSFGLTVDPHDRRPWAMAWWFVNDAGEITFFHEWPEEPYHEKQSTVMFAKQYADLIKIEEKKLGLTEVTWRFMDPNSGVRIHGTDAKKFQDEMYAAELNFDCEINDSLEQGHDAVIEYLDFIDSTPEAPGKPPKLYFWNKCFNIDYSLLRYVWKEKRTADGLSVIPAEKFKDFVDLVRYTCIKEPFYIAPGGMNIITPDAEEMYIV